MIREYLPFAGAVLTMLAGWMLAAWFAPSTPVLAALVFVAAFFALAVGVALARLCWTTDGNLQRDDVATSTKGSGHEDT